MASWGGFDPKMAQCRSQLTVQSRPLPPLVTQFLVDLAPDKNKCETTCFTISTPGQELHAGLLAGLVNLEGHGPTHPIDDLPAEFQGLGGAKLIIKSCHGYPEGLRRWQPRPTRGPMFPPRVPKPFGLPAIAIMLVLAPPAAAQVTIKLQSPTKLLEPGEEFLFKAVVEGTQNTEVHWSACELVKKEGSLRFFPLRPTSKVTFQKDAGHGLARFSAQGDPTQIRFFQIRAASRQAPDIRVCATIAVKPGLAGGSGTVKAWTGETRLSLVESKAARTGDGEGAAVEESRPWWYWEPPLEFPYLRHDAFQTPFHLDPKDAPPFRPEGFGIVQGKPCLLGTTLEFRDSAGWMGMDGKVTPLTLSGDEDFNALRFTRMAHLPDGNVAMVEEPGTRIWMVPPGGTPRILAGNGERGWNGVADAKGNPLHPHLVKFKRIVALAPLEDGSLAVADADGGRILQIVPESHVEILAGGGEGALTDQDLRQPPGQLRPALKLDLRGLTSLASSRDGHILFTGAGMGVCRLAPDGVVHQITRDRSCRAVETSDGRVVYQDEDGNLQHVVPGAEPKLLAMGEPGHPFRGEGGHVHHRMTVNNQTLGSIHTFFPAPGGGLLIHSTYESLGLQRIWYLAQPGEDGYWTRQVARMFIAMASQSWEEAARIHKWVAAMAAAEPSQVDRLESRLIQRVSKRGIPGLPPGVQRHIQGFLMDPFRAQVCLKHIEWNLQVHYPKMLESWDAYLQGKPAALPGRAAVEPKGSLGGSRGESKVESKGDSKRQAVTQTGAGAGAGFQPVPLSPSLELPDPGMEFPDPE